MSHHHQQQQHILNNQDFQLTSADMAPPDLNKKVTSQIFMLMPTIIQTMIPQITKEIISKINMFLKIKRLIIGFLRVNSENNKIIKEKKKLV